MDKIKHAFSYKGCCGHTVRALSPALELDKVSASYAKGQRKVIHDISLTVARNTRVALVGANGSGKSTLLKLVTGLLKTTNGSMEVLGYESGACQHQVAYLPQRSQIDWTFPVNVERFVLSGRYVHLGWLKWPTRKDKQKVSEVMELLGVSYISKRRISDLSGGEQQRMLLARTLVHGANLILLDEPMNAVDVDTKQIIKDTLGHIKAAGKTVIMATHDIDTEDINYDQVFFLREGCLVSSEKNI